MEAAQGGIERFVVTIVWYSIMRTFIFPFYQSFFPHLDGVPFPYYHVSLQAILKSTHMHTHQMR